jgi:CO/xanthine dehydrogenase Mo-binding subunit
MLHGRLSEPVCLSTIVSIDTSAARVLPGVIAALTHADVPQNALRMELPGRMAEATTGAVLATQPVLAEGRVRFQGEPVVAIAAETPEIAAEAAERVQVDKYAHVYPGGGAQARRAPCPRGRLLAPGISASDIAGGFARARLVEGVRTPSHHLPTPRRASDG